MNVTIPKLFSKQTYSMFSTYNLYEKYIVLQLQVVCTDSCSPSRWIWNHYSKDDKMS
jgi:hypothetical protein